MASEALKRGIRSICHATKKEYLQEERAGASPELRAAIDRIWQRILAEDR